MDYIIAHWGYLSVAHSQFTLLYMDLFFYRKKMKNQKILNFFVGVCWGKKGCGACWVCVFGFRVSSIDVHWKNTDSDEILF